MQSIAHKTLLPLSLALIATSCLSTQDPDTDVGARRIDDIADVEALPFDARPRIKVSVKQNVSGAESQLVRDLLALSGRGGTGTTGQGVEAMIEDALINCNRFLVVDNDAVDEVLDEQRKDKLGLTSEEGDINVGLAKAQYAVKVTITDLRFEEKKSGGGLSVPIPFVGRVGGGAKKAEAKVAMIAKITSLESGLIVQSVNASGRQASRGNDVRFSAYGVRGDFEDEVDPTLSNAIQECIKELVLEVSKAIPANE